MADGIVQLQTPADTAGAKLDSTQITRPGGMVVQRQRLDVVNRYYQKISDTKAVTGPGTRLNLTDSGPVRDWALQVSGVAGEATSWTVNLEVSLDGIVFQRILQHTVADLNGGVKFATGIPALYFQVYIAMLTLGATATGIVVTAIGT